MAEAIDYFIFRNWAKEHFAEYREKNGKIRLNSLFCEDHKFHMYCKPSIGMFKCMKSGFKGSLYELVMRTEKISYDEAVDILEGEHNLRYLESKLDKYLNAPQEKQQQFYHKKLELPPNSFLISSLSEQNHYRIRAENYLNGRKLKPKGLYVCVAGEYSNRIIIPYFDRKGELVYWNGRDLGNSLLRYRGPESNLGAKKEEVVWMEYFPKKDTKVYLTEGEFDAMALNECGFHAAAFGGASVNPKQLEMLQGYQLVLSFDADKAGKEGIMKLGDAIQQNGFHKINYVRPPLPFKDWNAMLQKHNKEIIQLYIHHKEKVFNSFTSLVLKNQI
jgi:DNA primase